MVTKSKRKQTKTFVSCSSFQHRGKNVSSHQNSSHLELIQLSLESLAPFYRVFYLYYREMQNLPLNKATSLLEGFLEVVLMYCSCNFHKKEEVICLLKYSKQISPFGITAELRIFSRKISQPGMLGSYPLGVLQFNAQSV